MIMKKSNIRKEGEERNYETRKKEEKVENLVGILVGVKLVRLKNISI